MDTKQVNRHFIVIDDDPINNHICSRFIEIVFQGADIKTLTHPETALEYIGIDYLNGPEKDTILFLDINMPFLSGWDVLNRFALLPEKIKKQFSIYMLSSSVDIEDRKRAINSPLVSGFIEKPLSIEGLQEMKLRLG